MLAMVWRRPRSIVSCLEPLFNKKINQHGKLGAPIQASCLDIPPGGKRKNAEVLEDGIMTDQDWQSASHSKLLHMFNAIATALRGPNRRIPNARRSISRFNLITINDASEAHASWIEANGVKRYCAGPGSGGDNRGCDKRIIQGRDYT